MKSNVQPNNASTMPLQLCSDLVNPSTSGAIQIYFVYATIQANPDITLNQLRWMMHSEFLLEQNVVDSAVASLTSRSLLNSVSKWQVHNKDTIHLKSKFKLNDVPPPWVTQSLSNHPELTSFEAPVFKKKDRS